MNSVSGLRARGERVAVWGIAGMCVVGVIVCLRVLLTGAPLVLHAAWALPHASFSMAIDALSAWFLLPLWVLGGAGAIYGRAYLAHAAPRKIAAAWWWYAWLIISMAVVFTARNALLFLIAWEAMTVASFFLVMLDHEEPQVRRAGFVYLVAAHLGTAVLIVMFIVLGQAWGSYDFGGPGSAALRVSLIFVLALAGFGVKAGFVPLHVWLPEAHPAAPSHVSALMSGVMIKTGVYGLVRVLTLIGPPQAWWGWVLIGIGVTSGVSAALHALAQRDMKRMLAYSSVDNIGIIMIGLGCGVLGMALNMPVMSVCGFGGALLHVLHHALFKGLLFFGAGAVVHATGVRSLEKLGGLARRMPWTGALCCTGALAMAAVPLLNGFASEALIYLSALQGMQQNGVHALPALAALAGLALTGGLAAACCAALYGVAFLGEPRSEAADQAREAGRCMRMPMLVLACLCVLTGMAPPLTLMLCEPALTALTGALQPGVVGKPFALLMGISTLALIVAALGAGVYALRRRLPARRMTTQQPTWGCGYAQPTPRMQYTSASFVQPLARVFQHLLSERTENGMRSAVFPGATHYARQATDLAMQRIYLPLRSLVLGVAGWLRIVQHGRVHAYLLYIVVTLLALLIWKAW